MKPLSESEYCGTACHEMDTAYQAWKGSTHGANAKGLQSECINCHIVSKDKYFTHLVAKAYIGTKSMYNHLFGGEYNSEKVRKRVLAHMPSKRCLNCHKDLLAKPSSDVIKEVHTESLGSADTSGNRCVDCHEDVGHQR